METAVRQNLKLEFDGWFVERVTACNSCYVQSGEVIFEPDATNCECEDESCKLVWCAPGKRDAPTGTCAELRWLHVKQGVPEWELFDAPASEQLTIAAARAANAAAREVERLQGALL